MAMTQDEIEIEVIADAECEAWEAWRRAPCCPQCGEIDHLEPGVPCGPDYAPEAEVRQAKPRRELPADYGHRREAASVGCRVDAVSQGRWEVHSPSGRTYVVRESGDRLTCTCPAGSYRRSATPEPCKHVAAVKLLVSDPASLVEAIRTDLLETTPDIPHAIALVEALGGLARL